MNQSIKLLDKYKKVCSLASDNAAAKTLGVGRSAVSKWRKEEGHPDADLIAVMCDATGENLAAWLPLIEAERARSAAARKVWLRMAAMAACLAIAAPLFASGNQLTLYIMSILSSIGVILAAWFATHQERHDVQMDF